MDAARLAQLGVGVGIGLIAAERQRQVEAEGFDPRHDDNYENDELVRAASSYLIAGRRDLDGTVMVSDDEIADGCWPWDAEWFKPSTPKANLIKAGALIAAELDRLVRAEAEANGA